MDVIAILVFISLVLVLAALVFFIQRLRDGDFEHGDRLSLLPLADDLGAAEGANEKKRKSIGSSSEPALGKEERATHEHRS